MTHFSYFETNELNNNIEFFREINSHFEFLFGIEIKTIDKIIVEIDGFKNCKIILNI